jgi:hypothetical protein
MLALGIQPMYINRRTYLAITLVLTGCLSASRTSSQAGIERERISPAAQAEFAIHIKSIRAELLEPNLPEWTGEYYHGDHLGANVSLSVAPRSGFAYVSSGDLGIYDLNYGGVEFADGKLKLNLKYPNDRKNIRGVDESFLPVHWGARHYLIPTDGVIKFANEINWGAEPNVGNGGDSYYFLLKRGDETKSVKGHPDLPTEFAGFVLDKPIHANISSMVESHLENECRTTLVTLNVGIANGLKAGMELQVIYPFQTTATATITAMTEHSATAVIKECGRKNPLPKANWKLSTKHQLP